MFMSWIGTFGSIVGRKEDAYVHWELIHELCISYELYKEINQFHEFINIHCI